ncbi:hypothetical protein [Methylobacterium sp. GC_Met_2]|uniref:hypothetical protein n=1 Tax=Methylobacterium sp. GC_Met_2 TaxID=2937376 RepID=UPI00226BB25F|nr:hypothetical protein [Methylobacterium sp. GC_Met_2]
MTNERTFTAGEAGLITGVNAVTQRDWRRRAILPEAEDGWVRHTLPDLCRLRLTKAMIEAGVPPGSVVSHISDQFLSMMQSALKGAEHPEHYTSQFALIAKKGEDFYYVGAVGIDDVAEKMRLEVDPSFHSCIIINLSALGAEMNERFNLIRRHEQFEQEAAKYFDGSAT